MISVGLKQLKHPEWVSDIFNKMKDEEKEYIVKTTLYMNLDKEPDGFKVTELLRKQANRVDTVFDLDHVRWIINTACACFSYFVAIENKDEIEFLGEQDQKKATKKC